MKYLALDIETIGTKPYNGTIWMVSVTEGNKTTLYEDCNGLKKIPAELKRKLEDPAICKVIHNSEFDGPYIGLNLGCKIRNIWDTYLCEIVINGMRVPLKSKDESLKQKYSAALNYTLQRYGFTSSDKAIRQNFIDREKGIPFIKEEKEYAKGDTKHLLKLQKLQEKILIEKDLLPVAELENKTAEKIIQMRINGIGFDSIEWEKILIENENNYKKRISKLPALENWGSPKQVKEYFFEYKDLPIDTFKNIYKIYLQTRDKLLAQFIWAKEIRVSITKYGRSWFEKNYIDADNSIRCNVDQIVDTGRMSISNPPLQGMPGVDLKNRQRLTAINLIVDQLKLTGRDIPTHRRAFIARPGKKFVIGDFTGQELGIMAAASGEELWINAMLRGEDVHSLMASLLFEEDWNKGKTKACEFPFKCRCPKHAELREPAKTLNFMLAYGGGWPKFSDDTGIEEREAKRIIYKYRKIIPILSQWLDYNGKQGLYTGYAYSADPYRRQRTLDGEQDWQIINQGKNTPVQSAGGNMLKHAMINLPDSIPIVLMIHDEIVCEVPDKQTAKAAKILKQTMENAANYITGIDGLIKVTPRISDNLMK